MIHKKTGRFQYPPSLIFVFIGIAFISLTSCCKKHENEDEYLEPVNISNNPGRSVDPSIAVDSKGTVHLVWADYTPGDGKEQIFYALKPQSGVWTVPVNVSNTSVSAKNPSLVVDKEDKLHLAYQQWSGGWVIFYSYQLPSGSWSFPETISTGLGDVCPKIDVDYIGSVFMVWYAGGYNGKIYFSMRQVNGTWTLPTTISQYGAVGMNPTMAVDIRGNVHVAWDFWDGGHTTNVFYTMRDTIGYWSAPSVIFAIDSFAFSPVLASDKNGHVHIAWKDSTLIYMYKPPDGNWSAPELPGVGASPDAIAIDNNGTVYMSYYGTRLIKKPKDGNWEKPILIVESSGICSSLAIDNEGIKHLTWYSTPPDTFDTSEIYYVEVKDY